MDGRRLFLYLDAELRGRELTEFESHLRECAGCQRAVAGRQRFLDEVRGGRAPVRAPADLQDRIEAILAKGQAAGRTPGFMERALSVLSTFRLTPVRTAFAALLALAVFTGVWLDRQFGHLPQSEFAIRALGAHQRRLHGRLPLGIQTSSAEAVSGWFHGKLSVNVKLPQNEELPPSEQPYQIEGAGLVPFHGSELGYIAYRVGNKLVSLLVAPASAVSLEGRKQVPMKSLKIHYDSAGGFHIVTWTVPRKGVTYALVSDASQHANQSCIVCHSSPRDREFMRSLLSQ